METLENIIRFTKLENKVVDVFKMDIEGGEIDVIQNLNIDYACGYFKQFVLETHPRSLTNILLHTLLRKLEPCFVLFHRNTRFIHYIILITLFLLPLFILFIYFIVQEFLKETFLVIRQTI